MTVGDEIDTWLIANTPPAKTGTEIKEGIVRKNRKTKHWISKLIKDGVITIDTADSSTDFRQWAKDTYDDVV